jgi:hypothetical protein
VRACRGEPENCEQKLRYEQNTFGCGHAVRPANRSSESTLEGTTSAWIMERRLVDLTGIEPVTSSMPLMRAPNCATGPLGKLLS